MVLAASVRPARLVGWLQAGRQQGGQQLAGKHRVAAKAEGGRRDAGRAGSGSRRLGLAQLQRWAAAGRQQGQWARRLQQGAGIRPHAPGPTRARSRRRRQPVQPRRGAGTPKQENGTRTDLSSQSATKCYFLVVVFCTHSVQRFPSRRHRFSAYLFVFSHFFAASHDKRKRSPLVVAICKNRLCALFAAGSPMDHLGQINWPEA
jgi:hypothetical protein